MPKQERPLREITEARVATLRDDLNRQYGIRMHKAAQLASLTTDSFPAQKLGEAVGVIYRQEYIDFVRKEKRGYLPDSLIQEKMDLIQVRQQIGQEAGVREENQELFWKTVSTLADEVRLNTELGDLDAMNMVVPGDPELTDPSRGLAGVRSGTSPYIWEQEANPKGLGYVQSNIGE